MTTASPPRSVTAPGERSSPDLSRDDLDGCEAVNRFDWRYYMVKYPEMREKGSSVYFTKRTADAGHTEVDVDNQRIDTIGRIQTGAFVVRRLLAAGL